MRIIWLTAKALRRRNLVLLSELQRSSRRLVYLELRPPLPGRYLVKISLCLEVKWQFLFESDFLKTNLISLGNTFGTATSSAPGTTLFGQPTQSTGLFGASSAQKPLFGSTTTATSTFTFNTPASTGGLFGQQPAQQTSVSFSIFWCLLF